MHENTSVWSALLKDATAVKDFSLFGTLGINTDGIFGDFTTAFFAAVFSEVTWPELKSFELEHIPPSGEDLSDFLLRHKDTLRELTFLPGPARETNNEYLNEMRLWRSKLNLNKARIILWDPNPELVSNSLDDLFAAAKPVADDRALDFAAFFKSNSGVS